ncbi:uncharacterized protein isoform X4 [Danio rerio]|uniref:Uncharacterized protein isoform X4 n=1 Tax=Danio rerio TaxID=7955 RepID=A0AC58H9B3_DANRE
MRKLPLQLVEEDHAGVWAAAADTANCCMCGAVLQFYSVRSLLCSSGTQTQSADGERQPEVRIIKGTVMINSVKREDSGNYRLELFNPDGTETSQYLQVNVEAPVGSVQVSIICSSNQMRSVSCSSEGDQLLYSWTLNGDTLMDGNSNIQLQEETKGEITCTVKNHVSQENTTVSIEDCPGLTTEAVTSSLTSTVTSSLTSTVTSSLLSTVSNNPTTSNCVSGWFVLVWFFQLMTLFALLGGFHIYIHTQVRKKNRSKLENTGRFREEHRAEDSTD